MSKGEWKIDDNDEEIFIDCEEESKKDDENHEYSYWHLLPDLILEQVFSYLSIRDRYYASMVCPNWYRAFCLQRVWSTFTLQDNTLTRRKFNYYYGWQHTLDHYRTQMCIVKMGRSFRRLVFEPTSNFYNLFEFMNMISFYAEQDEHHEQKVDVGRAVRSLCYHFPCNMAERDTERARTFGTGGKLLDSLKRLMGNLTSLRCLELLDLLLEPVEAQHLLDEVCCTCCLTLHTLSIVNATKLKYQILHAGVFLNLQVLEMSPQNVGSDLLQLLATTQLRQLHLVQNRYTPLDASFTAVPRQAWKQCRRGNPALRVHLELRGVTQKTQVIQQPGAPVKAVLVDSEYIKILPQDVMSVIDLYKADLQVFAHRGLPRFYQPRSFHERSDSLLLLLARQCPYLHTLMIRERVSTASVLLLAHTARNLRYLHIRRNAVILRCDWPRSPDWTPQFYAWLQTASRSYESVEREVGQIMGCAWHMLSDRQFKLTDVNVHCVRY